MEAGLPSSSVGAVVLTMPKGSLHPSDMDRALEQARVRQQRAIRICGCCRSSAPAHATRPGPSPTGISPIWATKASTEAAHPSPRCRPEAGSLCGAK